MAGLTYPYHHTVDLPKPIHKIAFCFVVWLLHNLAAFPSQDGIAHGAAELFRDQIVGKLAVPRYAMPSISSLLPAYRNCEQDYILRTFTTGNFDMIRTLPDHLRPYEVSYRAALNGMGISPYSGPILVS